MNGVIKPGSRVKCVLPPVWHGWIAGPCRVDGPADGSIWTVADVGKVDGLDWLTLIEWDGGRQAYAAKWFRPLEDDEFEALRGLLANVRDPDAIARELVS